MKAIVFHGPHDLRLDDVREPECREGEAILEVKYAGVCGSDLTIYQGKHTRAKPPTILGHEFSGLVVARRGEGYPQVKVGERVAVDPSYACGQCELCRSGNAHICHKKGLYGVDSDGGFARYVKVALSAPHKIPEWATFEEGVLVEPQAFRRTMAHEMGFTTLSTEEATREQIAELTGGRGVDVVFDAAGAAPAARMATQLVKRTGRIVIVAVYKEPVPFDLITLGYGENQILGSCIYTYKDFVKSVTLLEGRRVDLRPLVTHRLPLEDGIGAIESLTRGMSAQKVLLAVS
jgi:(R,R)-butanediol dehydrogenase/meso-butanediol dehydrogenase/diacetyl reductase